MKENHNTCKALLDRTLMLLLLLLMLTRFNATVHAQSAGTFTATGSMASPREGHTATLLLNGQVLIAGGESGPPSYATLSSAELYDPTTQTFTPTGSMTTPRAFHTATLLPDGRVLIAWGNPYWSAELYDPSTGTFTATGNLIADCCYGVVGSVLLQNGKVLIVAGIPQLYDPATGTFTRAGAYVTQPIGCEYCAPPVRLADGRVLLAENSTVYPPSWAEVYDPIADAWTVTGTPNISPSFSRVALLMTGKVLYAGGEDENIGYTIGAALYDPDAGTFTPTGNMAIPRDEHTLTLLPNGLVLTAGGQTEGGQSVTSAELYDASTGTFAPTGSMTIPRETPTATLLNDGTVLITGGLCFYGCGWPPVTLASAELYTPQ
jgi:hypothetical protein